MQRFLRLAGFLGQAAGTAEEQAKNFRWGLHKSILDHVMCIQFTDVAQVADAARNLEILRDRDDYDRSERSDKRHKSGDRYHPYSQQGSHRSHGQSDDRQKNDRQGSDRQGGGGYESNITSIGVPTSRVPSEGYTSLFCYTLGRRHPGECYRDACRLFPISGVLREELPEYLLFAIQVRYRVIDDIGFSQSLRGTRSALRTVLQRKNYYGWRKLRHSTKCQDDVCDEVQSFLDLTRLLPQIRRGFLTISLTLNQAYAKRWIAIYSELLRKVLDGVLIAAWNVIAYASSTSGFWASLRVELTDFTDHDSSEG
ncbi:hypothetical protein Tco_0204339 [Tanacetum coccineum]